MDELKERIKELAGVLNVEEIEKIKNDKNPEKRNKVKEDIMYVYKYISGE